MGPRGGGARALAAADRARRERARAAPAGTNEHEGFDAASAADGESAAVWIFAYGSLVNAESASAQLGADASAPQAARLRATAGFARAWSFNSPTGFTALGVAQADRSSGAACDINGALLRVPAAKLPALDVRESGYARLELDAALFDRHRSDADVSAAHAQLWPRDRVYVWVPEQQGAPSEDCPILQSYVDACLEGFLSLGGEAFAREFVESTSGWCEFFLNDCPFSRRPWLHRGKAYAELDRVLAQSAGVSASRHPEEFAALQLRRHAASEVASRGVGDASAAGAGAAPADDGAAVQARGLWGVPSRNPHFTGREGLLEAMRRRLCLSAESSAARVSSIKSLAVVGMGGVGKSQTVAEFCHRSYPSSFDLVLYIRAETQQSMVSDLHRFARDAGLGGDGASAEEALEALKAFLFRCRLRWMLVFDNAPDRSFEAHVPRGGAEGGAIVYTSQVDLEQGSGGRAAELLRVDCFSQGEAVAFLERASGAASEAGVSGRLVERLGALPLALGVAAAYMQVSDCSAEQYLDKLKAGAARGIEGVSSVVDESLLLSLERIAASERHGAAAKDALDALAFASPDDITKNLLRYLLAALATAADERGGGEVVVPAAAGAHMATCAAVAAGAFAAIWAAWPRRDARRRQQRLLVAASAAAAAGSASAAACWLYERSRHTPAAPPLSVTRSACPDAALDSRGGDRVDSVWATLKRFSLLSVKAQRGRSASGSLHRLLGETLRARLGTEGSGRSLRTMITALSRAWLFDEDDQSTFSAAAGLSDHIVTASSYALRGDALAPAELQGLAVLLAEVAATMQLHSRFGEAEQALLQALRAHARLVGASGAPSGILEAASAKALPGLAGDGDGAHRDARTDLALGKILLQVTRVLRYRPALASSARCAAFALGLFQRDDGTVACEDRALLASLYFESGVIATKQRTLERAKELLEVSLGYAAGAHQRARTLHQLGVVALCKRPRPDTTTAELLLKRSLQLEEGRGVDASRAARGATLQQLGRVYTRSGDFAKARTALERALELAGGAGDSQKGGAHTLNVASVREALAALAAGQHNWSEARLQLRHALEVHITVWGPVHIHVARTLGRFAEVERAAGSPGMAYAALLEQRALAHKLCPALEQGEQSDTASLSEASLAGARELQRACAQLRSSARARGDKAAAAVFGEEEKCARLLLALPQSRHDEAAAEGGLRVRDQDMALVDAICVARAAARGAALAASKTALAAPANEVETIVAALEAALAFPVPYEDGDEAEHAALRGAGEALVCALRGARDGAGALLTACDDARSQLRDLGVAVTDR